MKMRLLLVGLIVGRAISLGEEPKSQNDKAIWGRSLIGEAFPDGKDKRLALFDISQGREHLLGGFVLTREVEGTTPQLTIQGHFNTMGEFTPNVSLEVSDREKDNWKTIESSFSEKVDLTLTGAAHIDKLFIRIQLDALQAYIGKFKFCRIVLQTGESNVFPLVWLTQKGE
jgi:hypothetical protein